MKNVFRKFASRISAAAGSAYTFVLAVLLVVGWAISGPAFKFSNTWQLFINTGTTIMTFLMVFLIQNTQNREGKAMQLKLDELLRSGRGRDSFIDIEDMSDEELAHLNSEFDRMHADGAMHPTVHKLSQKIKKVREIRTKK